MVQVIVFGGCARINPCRASRRLDVARAVPRCTLKLLDALGEGLFETTRRSDRCESLRCAREQLQSSAQRRARCRRRTIARADSALRRGAAADRTSIAQLFEQKEFMTMERSPQRGHGRAGNALLRESSSMSWNDLRAIVDEPLLHHRQSMMKSSKRTFDRSSRNRQRVRSSAPKRVVAHDIRNDSSSPFQPAIDARDATRGIARRWRMMSSRRERNRARTRIELEKILQADNILIVRTL